jgi:hypothetical protein
MALLTACARLFFKRAPEMKESLGTVLSLATGDSSHQDAHDRAMLYYRLFAHDVDEAGRVINGERDSLVAFAEGGASETREKVFAEFNTLSVVYGMPSERFIVRRTLEEEIQERAELAEAQARDRASSSAAADTAAGGAAEDDGEDEVEEQEGLLSAAATENLVDFGGAAPAAGAGAQIAFDAAVGVEPAVFQQQWGACPAETLQFTMGKGPAAVEGALAARGIRCIASGAVEGKFKGYFYATVSGAGQLVMAEVLADVASKAAQVTAKSQAPGLPGQFLKIVAQLLA